MSGDEFDTGELFHRRTREDWLLDAYEKLRDWFAERADVKLPEMIRLSAGFGYGAKSENKIILGQCWATWKAKDKVNQVFLSPEVADPIEILAIMVHELAHVVDDCKHKHAKPFRDIALAVGLTGKMTEVHVTDALRDYLALLAIELGDYPHSALIVTRTRKMVGPDGKPTTDRGRSGPEKQEARMIKFECLGCGWTGRSSAKWLRTPPMPEHCGQPMEITDVHWEG